jgi:hypothetical protein
MPGAMTACAGCAELIIFRFSTPFLDLRLRGRNRNSVVASAARRQWPGISVSSTALAGVAVTTVAGNIQATSEPNTTSGPCSASGGGGVVLRHEHLAMAMMQGGTTPGEACFGTEAPPAEKYVVDLSMPGIGGHGGGNGHIHVVPARPR